MVAKKYPKKMIKVNRRKQFWTTKQEPYFAAYAPSLVITPPPPPPPLTIMIRIFIRAGISRYIYGADFSTRTQSCPWFLVNSI